MGDDGVALVAHLVEDARLSRIERRRLVCVAAAGRPVREQAVVQLVRRDDAPTLERGGDAVSPRRQTCPLSVHARQP